jgi:hypothetical protein
MVIQNQGHEGNTEEEKSGYGVFTESTNQLGNREALPAHPSLPAGFLDSVFKDDVDGFSPTSNPGEAKTFTLYIKVIEQNERR